MHQHLVQQFRQMLRARLTLGLLALLIGLECWKQIAVHDVAGFYRQVALSRGGIQSLALWQLPGYSLFHQGWFHLLMNGLLLAVAATRIEWILGRRVLLGVFLAGVLAGGLLHLALSPNLLVGASAGALAVLLCHATLSPDSSWLVPFRLSGKNLGRGLISASMILVLMDPDHGVPWFSDLGERLLQSGLESLFRISHACHLGGALAGWACGRWMLRPRVSLASLQRARARREGPW